MAASPDANREEKERFLEEAQHAARAGWYSLDIATGNWRSSTSLDRIFGIEGLDFARDVSGWLRIVHEDERAGMQAYFLHEVLERRNPFDRQYRITRVADGETRWVHGRGGLTFDAAGNPLAMAGLIQDITEQKLAEQERERLQAQLTQAEKMESVGRLAGGVAHDFNNMLQSILGNVELALASDGLSDDVRSCLEEIRTSAERSADLTKQLLQFARKQTIQPRVVDLRQVVQDVLKMLQRLIGEDVRLQWSPGTAPCRIKIDPGQVERILTNLALNARDAMAAGGVVRIETSSVTISGEHAASFHQCAPGEYAVLTVADAGRGMDADTREHLFEPFFTTKGRGKGTGLGLATVFGIVKQNGGFIEVQSEVGEGTSFRIYIPRVESDLEDAEAPAAVGPVQGVETVLLVEDEAQILTLGRQILERNGYTVLAASDPAAALELSRAHSGRIELLVTDVIMPGMNGRELAKVLEQEQPGLKCLFMSGHTANVIEHHGVLDAGIEFIPKPFTVQEFIGRVRRVLDRPS